MTPTLAPDIVSSDATTLAAAIRARTVSCVDVMGAYLDRIERLNPAVNAIVSLRGRAACLADAAAADAVLASGGATGPLHGLPLAVKDLEAAAGLPLTLGSPLFRDQVAESDSIMVARLKAAGGIVVAKTNVPEFGLGSQTYNTVFGATGNAYDPTKTAGGSSGGAGAALALRMLPVADGSDHAGSLRNPAAFNNVFGLRPTPGRVPTDKTDAFLPSLTVLGPMARTVPDLALLLGVMAGPDPRVPGSLAHDPALSRPPETEVRGLRLGWLGDLDGHLPVEDGILDLCRGALRVFEDLGAIVEEARLDVPASSFFDAWLPLRGFAVASGYAALARDPAKRALMKDEALADIERGLALSALDVAEASAGRTAWFRAMARLFARYDALLLPAAQVFPYDKTTTWPRAIAGRPMDTYHRWLEAMIPATMAGSPAISIPAGFGPAGLPTGIQAVAPFGGEAMCLRLAAAHEAAARWIDRAPVLSA